MSDYSLFAELKKRKVVQVAAIYGVVAWGVTEIVVTIVEQLFLPTWVSTLAVIAFVVGFPIAMFLSWTFDITPDGIQRTSITSRRGKASIIGAVSLLIVCTAGLFVLIKPSTQGPQFADAIPNSIAVLPFENVGGNADDLEVRPRHDEDLAERILTGKELLHERLVDHDHSALPSPHEPLVRLEEATGQ